MHEFAISQQIVEVVLRTAQENEAREVERVVVVIGELALISEEQVRFWVQEMFSHKPLTRHAELEMVCRPAVVSCPSCQFKGPPPAPGPEAHFMVPLLTCPRCNQQGLVIEEGRECLIERITLKR
jgi:hydrogenase nickel insertion protein HypA